MIYRSILNDETYRFEEKKSIFISHIKGVDNEDSAKKFIEEIKKKYYDARHNVYGYVIGKDISIQKYSDDGEPQGVAGIPIVDVINKNNLTNVIVVVTRYFGGILLGFGGLARAYVKACSEVIKKSKIIEVINGNALHVKIDYELMGSLQHYLNENKIYIDKIDYEDKVIFKIRYPKEGIQKLKTEIINLTSNNLEIKISRDAIYFKIDDRYLLENEI